MFDLFVWTFYLQNHNKSISVKRLIVCTNRSDRFQSNIQTRSGIEVRNKNAMQIAIRLTSWRE